MLAIAANRIYGTAGVKIGIIDVHGYQPKHEASIDIAWLSLRLFAGHVGGIASQWRFANGK